MPAAPYSVNIFRYPGFSGGPTLVYTTPAGYRAVLKSITVVWGDLIASGMDFWLQTAEGCKLIRSTWFATPSDVANRGGTNLYWGSWVLEEGEPLSAQSVAGTVDVQANGYLLRLP